MRKFLTFIAILAVASLANAQGYVAKVHGDGPDKLVVESGGEIEMASGSTLDLNGTIDIDAGLDLDLAADELVSIDGATTAQTQLLGMLDLNFASITANTSAINLLCVANDGTTAANDIFCGRMLVQANDADADMFGLQIILDATSNAAANSYEYGVLVDCEENSAGACIDGLLLTSSGVANGMVDAVDASAANITNAINTGDNILLMAAGNIDADSLAVDTTDDMTFTVTAGAAGEDFIVDQNGNYDASILISTEGSGTDAISLSTLTNSGDIVISSHDDIQITSTTASGLIDIDGTAGLVYSIAEDDTTADDIDIGSAKDDVLISGEDITLTTADDFDVTSTTASGIIALGGTPGLVFNIATDDTTADDVNIGSAKDDVDLAGEDIALTSADDIHILGGSSGSIVNIATNNNGNVVNIATDNTAKDTINIGSALDDVGLVSGAGAEAAAGNVCAERCVGGICQTVCTLTAVSVTITDPGGAAAYGGVKIYDFPAGYINRLGIVADITATEASGTISDTWDGDVSFGSTAADATPTLHNPTTEDDWVPTAATTTAIASVAASDTQSTVTEQTICDGHSAACVLYLNYEIDDASITTGGADAITIDGTVTITWLNLGDN